MHFLWKFFCNFLQTLNFVRPRAKIEKFYDMSNILHMPIIFFKIIFNFQNPFFYEKYGLFWFWVHFQHVETSVPRAKFSEFLDHISGCLHNFFQTRISKTLWYELLFVEFSTLALRMNVSFETRDKHHQIIFSKMLKFLICDQMAHQILANISILMDEKQSKKRQYRHFEIFDVPFGRKSKKFIWGSEMLWSWSPFIMSIWNSKLTKISQNFDFAIFKIGPTLHIT